MLSRVLVRLVIVVPTVVGAVLAASAGGDAVPFEARILAGALSFSAVVIARDNRSALVRGVVCVALSIALAVGMTLIGRS